MSFLLLPHTGKVLRKRVKPSSPGHHPSPLHCPWKAPAQGSFIALFQAIFGPWGAHPPPPRKCPSVSCNTFHTLSACVSSVLTFGAKCWVAVVFLPLRVITAVGKGETELEVTQGSGFLAVYATDNSAALLEAACAEAKARQVPQLLLQGFGTKGFGTSSSGHVSGGSLV